MANLNVSGATPPIVRPDATGVKLDFEKLKFNLDPTILPIAPKQEKEELGPILDLFPGKFREMAKGIKRGRLQNAQQDALMGAIEMVGSPELDDQGNIAKDENGKEIWKSIDLVDADQRMDMAMQFAHYNQEVEKVKPGLYTQLAMDAAAAGDGLSMVAALAIDPIESIGFLASESASRNPLAAMVGFIPIFGTFIGSYLAERRGNFANNITQIIEQSGGDPNDPDDVFLALSSEEAVRESWERAAKGSLATAATETAVEAATFGLSRKLVPISVGGSIVKGLALLGSESVGETAGAAAAQVATGEKLNMAQASLEGLAALGQSTATTVGTQAVQSAMEKGTFLPTPEPASQASKVATMDEAIAGMERQGYDMDTINKELLGDPTRDSDVFKSLDKETQAAVKSTQRTAQGMAQVIYHMGWPTDTNNINEEGKNQPIGYEELMERIEEAEATLPPTDDEQTDILTHTKRKVLNRARARAGLAQAEKGVAEAWNRSMALAEKKGYVDQAERLAQKLLTDEEFAFTTQMHAGMQIAAAAHLEAFHENMARYVELSENPIGNRAQQQAYLDNALLNRDRADLITMGLEKGKSRAGQTLVYAKSALTQDDYSLDSVLKAMEAARGGDPVPTEQIGEVVKMVEEKNAAEQEVIKQEENKAEMQTRKLREASEIIMERRRERLAKIQLNQEQVEVLDADIAKLKQDLNKLGYRANDIVGYTTEALAIVSKIAAKYMQKGFLNLDSLVTKLKNDFPGLTDDDAYEAILGTTEDAAKKVKQQIGKRRAKVDKGQEIMKAIEQIRKSDPQKADQLLTELKALAADIFDTDEQKISKINKEIEALRKQLPPEAVVPPPRDVAPRKPKGSEKLRKKQAELSQLKRALRLEKEAARLDKLAEQGVPDPRSTKKKIVIEEIPELRDAKIRLELAKRNLNRAIVSQRALSITSAGDVLGEANSLLRTLMATADMSSLLRQGLPLSVANPLLARGPAASGIKSFFSKEMADALNIAMREHPNFLRHLEYGVEYTTFGSGRTELEEFYQSDLIRRIPAFSELDATQRLSQQQLLAGAAKEAIDASERIMVTHLNLLRFAVFDQFLDPNLGISDEALKLAAKYVNQATGRGEINAGLLKSLNNVLFAPRFTWSRVQLPVTVGRMWLSGEPALRKQAAKQTAGFVGLGVTVLGLASLAGLAVGLDPEDSDFGKIIVGNTRVDIWGGQQQLASLIARTAFYTSKELGLAERLGQGAEQLGFERWAAHLRSPSQGPTPRDLANNFAHFKFSPLASGLMDFFSQETAVGEEVTIEDFAKSRVIPLFLQDAIEAFEQDAVMGGVATAGAFFGLSVNTFGDSFEAADIEPIMKAARGESGSRYRPNPPKYPEEVKEDTKLKDNLDDVFALIMATNIRARPLYKELAKGDAVDREILREELEKESAIAKQIMKRYIPGLESDATPEEVEAINRAFVSQIEDALKE